MSLDKFKNMVFQNGWIRKKTAFILTALSLILIFGSLWLIDQGLIDIKFGLFLCMAGVFIGLTIGYEGKAKQFGYQAPFTNDPLGWRKAKQSYKQEPNEPSEPAQPQDDQTPKRDEP